ncbi:MAG: extracellular solute-binding protein [Patescibacteria group bacterium]|jgi:ABC-type glycerol-3-phosphate transport system substrate-binding protein
MRKFSFRKLLGLPLVLSVLIGAGCTNAPDAATVAGMKPKTLNIWAVVDDEDAYAPIIQAYRAAHPQITINYRRFRLEEYESAVLNGLAEDKGPDIFLIHNTWIGKYLSKIEPMPPFTSMVYRYVSGGATNQSETLVLKNEKSPTLKELRDAYPDVVAKDVIRRLNMAAEGENQKLEDRIVALPMSVDTLAMFVNKDLLNSAGVATIPAAWDTFQSTMKRIVRVDDQGKLIQAGAALGLADNVERSTDILSALMMQNRTIMASDDGYPTFAQMPAALADTATEVPGVQALRFYLDFAKPDKDSYTWSADMPNSLDAFIQGQVAFFFGYSYHLPLIKARAPKLNLSIAKLPQISENPTVNYANYWVWVVAKKSKNTDTAWNLLNFMTTPDNEKKFLDLAKRPAAHKSLLEGQLDDEELGVFASQVLTSSSWYKGMDPAAMEKSFAKMINNGATAADEDLQKVLSNAQSEVSQTMTATQ